VPDGDVGVVTEVGDATIRAHGGELAVRAGVEAGTPAVHWPGAALAQLVTGYQSSEVVCALHPPPLPRQALDLLSVLFPPRWRFSRNEAWTYSQ
jgi:hypothetical protein